LNIAYFSHGLEIGQNQNISWTRKRPIINGISPSNLPPANHSASFPNHWYSTHFSQVLNHCSCGSCEHSNPQEWRVTCVMPMNLKKQPQACTWILHRISIQYGKKGSHETVFPYHSRRHNPSSRFLCMFRVSKNAADSTIHHILIRCPSRICSCHYVVSHTAFQMEQTLSCIGQTEPPPVRRPH
jgi:hypothetical protein